MTNQTIGAWISDDGTVGTPDPSNPYRYVGNHPTNAVDPSGLAEEFVSGKQLNFKMPGFTGAEMATLTVDMRLAVRKLDKALSMLTEHWDELKDLSTFIPQAGAKPFVSMRYRTLASKYTFTYGGWGMGGVYHTTVREEYILLIRQVLNPLRNVDHVTTFKPDRSPPTPNGRKAYVVYTLGIPGSTIYITNLFFTRPQDEQVDDIVHELGRRIGFSEENTGNIFKDVYEWDLTIDFLAKKYDELMSNGK